MVYAFLFDPYGWIALQATILRIMLLRCFVHLSVGPDFFCDPDNEGELLHDVVLRDEVPFRMRREAALWRDAYPAQGK